MINLYYSHIKGHQVTERDLLEELFTDAGGGLFAYSVMLGIAGRTKEAEQMELWRNRIFHARDNLSPFSKRSTTVEQDASDMRSLYNEMKIFVDMLVLYRPGESIIFQTPLNLMAGLARNLEEYYERHPEEKV